MNKKEAWGEVDFTGEEAAAYGYAASLRENKQAHFPLSFRSSRGFLATAIKIGHCEVLLELVHNNENFNETIGPKAGIRIHIMHRVASKTIKINHGRRNECLPWRITGYVIVKYSIITVK